MQELQSWLTSHPPVAGRIAVTIGVLLAHLLLRWTVLRWLRVRELPSQEMRRRWVVIARNLTLVSLLFSVVLIWGEEIRTFALSLAAFAVATVIASKELITCLSGAILRTSSRGFTVGDRIELDGLRGDVVDYNLLTTTIMEVGPVHMHTGRAVVIPNSELLLHPLVNESFMDDFVFHSLVVPLDKDEDWAEAERALLAAAEEVSEPYRADAEAHFMTLGERLGMSTPVPNPRVSLRLVEPGRPDLVVRFAVPARQKGRHEQAVLRGFLTRRRAAASA